MIILSRGDIKYTPIFTKINRGNPSPINSQYIHISLVLMVSWASAIHWWPSFWCGPEQDFGIIVSIFTRSAGVQGCASRLRATSHFPELWVGPSRLTLKCWIQALFLLLWEQVEWLKLPNRIISTLISRAPSSSFVHILASHVCGGVLSCLTI